MPRRFRQHGHGRTEQQGKNNQYANGVECVPRSHRRGVAVEVDRTREVVHGYYDGQYVCNVV